ncbi:hypothetical protein DL769_001698 [Monosporascus sp. CRB-8-3]|nr:hypothetical protein DL769_001698 [Monosporascus sp. CRB-8-3]
MLFESVAITAALAASTSAQLSHNITRSCGTPLLTEAQIQASQQMLQDERVRIASGVRPLRALTVDTYFHAVAASKAEEDGYATEQQLNDQFDVLNAAYASHGITFNLLGKDWTALYAVRTSTPWDTATSRATSPRARPTSSSTDVSSMPPPCRVAALLPITWAGPSLMR